MEKVQSESIETLDSPDAHHVAWPLFTTQLCLFSLRRFIHVSDVVKRTITRVLSEKDKFSLQPVKDFIVF